MTPRLISKTLGIEYEDIILEKCHLVTWNLYSATNVLISPKPKDSGTEESNYFSNK